MMSLCPRRAFAAVVVLAIAAATTARAQDFPFTAAITSDKVNVRSGPGQNYYTVSQLNKGDLVEVHDNLYGWMKIAPPPGSFSYVAKEYVKVEADGASGTITGDRVRVRAPSPLGPDTSHSYRAQTQLDIGAKVRVIGQAGDFYKIEPPQGAWLYISQEFAAKATPAQIAAARNRPATAAAPSAPEAPAAPAPPPAPTTPAPATGAATATAPEAPAAPTTPITTATAPMPPAPATELPGKPETFPQLVAEVQADGSVVVDGQKLDADGFTAAVKKKLEAEPTTQVALRSAGDVKLETMTGYMQAAKAAGASNVSLSGTGTTVVARDTTPPGSTPGGGSTPGTVVSDKPVSAMSPSERFADLENRFAEAAKLPLAQRPVSAMRLEYEQLLSLEDLPTYQKDRVQMRLEMLKNLADAQNSIAEITMLRNQALTTQKAWEQEEAKKPKSYIAVGRLVASSLYTGDKLPRLYRLVDPGTGLTTAYVQPQDKDQPMTLTAMLGQYVGVVGSKEYDPALKLNVVTAKEVDVLTPLQQP